MSIDDDVVEIIKNYPESKWLDEIKKKYPIDDKEMLNYIISIFEIHSGGDVIETND